MLERLQDRSQGAAHADGLAAVIEMVLQSPQFLYRVESGLRSPVCRWRSPPRTRWPTRLSYMLWGSMPDPS